MAGLYNLMILGIMLIGVVVGVEGVTDQQFHELMNLVKGLQDENKELSTLVKKLQDENEKQFRLISQLRSESDQQIVINNQQTAINEQLKATLGINSLQSEPKIYPETAETAQNVTIEERVSLLEIQVSDLEQDVVELDENVDFLFDEQVIQDERLFSLEEENDQTVTELIQINEDIQGLEDTTLALDFRVTVLEETGGSDGNSSISELEVRVETLEGTAADHETRITSAEGDIEDLQGTSADHETRLTSAEENIQGLQMTDINHDARIIALEENGGGGSSQNETIAFHAILTDYDTLSSGDTLVFNQIELNEGNGYDSTTGVFTVPPGGDGTYYFSMYLLISGGASGQFEIRSTDGAICYGIGDHDSSGELDFAQATCSGVIHAVAGNQVRVQVYAISDDTPLHTSAYYVNGFNGFRV